VLCADDDDLQAFERMTGIFGERHPPGDRRDQSHLQSTYSSTSRVIYSLDRQVLICDPSAQNQSHFWLFEYDTPFERRRKSLYNDTKIILLSQS